MTPVRTRARIALGIAAAFFVTGFLLRIDEARLDLLGVSAVIFMAALLIVDAIVEATEAAKRDRASAPSGRSPSDAAGVGATGEESSNG